MVAIDTSVWIEFFRAKKHACKDEVFRLLDEDLVVMPYPVLAEILTGLRTDELSRVKDILGALPVVYPTQSDCDDVTGMIEVSRKKGYQFGFADLLIAALANSAKAALWSFDSDFSNMHKTGLIYQHPWKNT